MATAVEILQALGSFLLGLAGRVGIFFIAGLALVAPALLLALGWRALVARRAALGRAAGEDARPCPNHTWVAPRRRGRALAVGVDELAQRILPSATAVELPARGMVVHRGDPIAVIRAGRHAVRIGSPVDGTIVGVNGAARRNPALVKEDPYGKGWLFLVAPADDAWRSLPSGMGADLWMAAERRRLALLLEEHLGLAAADGGELLEPAPALLGEEGWRRLVATFLHAA
jgi:glycine cleavage system H lipoate-binding protein